jgi:hypothetical protein
MFIYYRTVQSQISGSTGAGDLDRSLQGLQL